MKLVVIIPCYNEEKTLPLVLKTIPKKIKGIRRIEKVIIDDGSTDNTPSIGRKHKVIVVTHKKNLGLGNAFKSGIKKALELKADIAVTLDGDMQFDPLDIPKIISPILEGKGDVVTATRYKEHLEYNLKGRGIKNFGNKFFALLINKLTGKSFSDVSCGFRAYNRESLLRLTIFGHFTYTHEVFLDLIHKKLIIREVPVKVRPKREYGESKISGNLANYGFSALKIIFRSIRDHRPLEFFAIPGVYIFVLGLIFNSIFVVGWALTERTTPFRTYGFVGSFLMVGGFLLFLLGLIADMIGRIKDMEEEVLYQVRKLNSEHQPQVVKKIQKQNLKML